MRERVLAKAEGCRLCLAGGNVVRPEHTASEKRIAARSAKLARRVALPRLRNRFGSLFAASTRPPAEFTAWLAWFVFKENFDARIAWGMGLIAAGGVCLSWMGRPESGLPWGALAIVGACLAWAVDNNLTRKVSADDPVQIAMIKEHLHTHDEHHQHAHAPSDPPGEPHSHPHRHEALTHPHPHYPDIHHRHTH